MTSIATLLAEATDRLAAASESPRLDAEVLLAHAIGVSRTYLFTWPDREPEPESVSRFGDLLERRFRGEPVAYLTGCREFWSRDFLVTPDVLIPRPETELLVELALQAAAKFASPRILDLGTGSGAVAITLAAELPTATVTAVDISQRALDVARSNADRHRLANMRFYRSDWFADIDSTDRFDLIVSNPPYIAEADAHLDQGDVRLEPRTALVSGEDGLDDIRHIVSAARRFLAPGAWLLFEHGWDQGRAAAGLLAEAGYVSVETRVDHQGNDRVSQGCWPMLLK